MADSARPLLDGDEPAPVPAGSNQLDLRCRQFVARWCFFKHHQEAALVELRELIAEAKK